MALRELALILVNRGKLRAARRAVDRSIAVATRQKARHERTRSLPVREQIARRLGRKTSP